jgi:flagellar hook-basal body protein
MEQVFDPVTGNRMENQWRYFVWSPDTEPPTMAPEKHEYYPPGFVSGDPGDPPPDTLGWGTLVFAANGKLIGHDPEASLGINGVPAANINNTDLSTGNLDVGTPPTVAGGPPTLKWSNGASEQPLEWKINTGTPDAPNFLITQVAAKSGTTNSKQNGYGAGVMQGITVDSEGIIKATFTNGQTYGVGQVALSIFTNNNGLMKIGQNIWKETVASGPASVGVANDVGRGAILGAHYEMSNVDVADEFTRLIITQRGYQANSRIVTTSDEMMVETLNLKR